MFFWDLDITTLLYNYSDLNIQETLEMLKFFYLKLKFPMKIKFYFIF
jgi:hypothetical protein